MEDRLDGRKSAREQAASPDAVLDARGLRCPLPVLKARKRLEQIAPGGVLEVLADDPAAWIDVPHFCAEAGHELVDSRDLEPSGDAGEAPAAAAFRIRKAAPG